MRKHNAPRPWSVTFLVVFLVVFLLIIGGMYVLLGMGSLASGFGG